MTVTYRRHPDVRLADLDDRGVALHLGERRYFTVNDTGAVLLHALETACTLEQLSGRLCEEFDVTPDEARRTCEAFLAECVSSKLVVTERA